MPPCSARAVAEGARWTSERWSPTSRPTRRGSAESSTAWSCAHPGRDRRTVEKFLDLLGKERCHQLRLVSCDLASWITVPISERCPNANICYDPSHLVALASYALDEIRREV